MEPLATTHATLREQQGPASAPGEARSGLRFSDVVKGVLEDANRQQQVAESEARALAEGRGDVVDAMVALSRADLAVRFVVTLRNRALEAYQEIMRLQF